jgi:hypothetical protein
MLITRNEKPYDKHGTSSRKKLNSEYGECAEFQITGEHDKLGLVKCTMRYLIR